jgi:hypothetical protein
MSNHWAWIVHKIKINEPGLVTNFCWAIHRMENWWMNSFNIQLWDEMASLWINFKFFTKIKILPHSRFKLVLNMSFHKHHIWHFWKKKRKKKEVHIGPFFIPCPKHAFETLTLVKRAKLGKLGIGLNEPTNGDLCHYQTHLNSFPPPTTPPPCLLL